MNEFMHLLLALLEGILLGMFFFVGLWWTVRQLDASKHVAFFFLASMLLRTIVVILGFYFILGDNWQHLLAGLLGFVAARIMTTRFTRDADQPKPLLCKAGHES